MLGWVMGDVSGRVSALAVHPEDETILYLGSASGGLWKTLDGGGSWQSVFDDVGTQTIGALFIDPSSPDTVWVGTGEQGQSCTSYFGMGLYRSTDGGQSFFSMNGSGDSSLDLSFISSIVVNPDDPDIVMVAGESWCNDGEWLYGGLYRSVDGGASWQQVISGAVTDLVMDPAAPGTLWCAVGRWSAEVNGIYRSTDGGETWERLETGLPVGTAVGRSRLAVAASDSRIVYALINDGNPVGLYRSTDGGDNWTLQNSDACDGQCWYNLCLDVHPTDPDRLLVGAIRFYGTMDGGTNLTVMTEGWGPGQKVHQDTHVLTYSTVDPNRFWVAGDGGIWRTDNGGSSFANLNANLNLTQYYDIAVHPWDRATIFGGSQDNSSSGTTGDLRWDVTVVTGDGFMNVVDPVDPRIVIQTSYPWDGLPSLFLSTSGGGPNSFEWLWLEGVTQYEPWPWVTPLVGVASSSSEAESTHLFMGSDHVYRSSTSNPRQWTKISSDLTGPNGSLRVLTAIPTGDTVMVYAGTSNGRIHRTDDALADAPVWENVTGNFPLAQVTDIAVDPLDSNIVYATRGAFGPSNLYRSNTGGTQWQPFSTGLPNVPANAVAVDPLDRLKVFVGTDVGVFLGIGQFGFSPMMDGMPLGAVITDLEIDDDPHILTAGTYGRGAWRYDLSPPPTFADGFESGDESRWSSVVE